MFCMNIVQKGGIFLHDEDAKIGWTSVIFALRSPYQLFNAQHQSGLRVGREDSGGCVINMMWKTAAEANNSHEFDRRIFATREAARRALLGAAKGADFRIAQDGVRRASIELIIANKK